MIIFYLLIPLRRIILLYLWYNILLMSLGFIIIRHVNSKISDYYWKECYTCIRKFYDNPIVIIDDSSNKEFLNENIFLLFFLHIFYVREWMCCCFFSPQYLICTKQTTISWLFQLCTAHVWSWVDYCACVLQQLTTAHACYLS